MGLKDKGLPFDYVYSSDAGRARETAQFVLEELGQKDTVINESRDLREMFFGKFEGEVENTEFISVFFVARQYLKEHFLYSSTMV
ncbi:histidine phosphatase family protein [Vagococcus lutrae]|uniref:histidine phosphatase family protein n=1 Tax=Vagococcus lutrae TaxID=81947 RepID=UPI0023A94FDD|nr:histidine phosphatase family protein [Vagococcus lutrae]WEB80820.1 histidine phosphatase family protein [Vagococcus lutrae]